MTKNYIKIHSQTVFLNLVVFLISTWRNLVKLIMYERYLPMFKCFSHSKPYNIKYNYRSNSHVHQRSLKIVVYCFSITPKQKNFKKEQRKCSLMSKTRCSCSSCSGSKELTLPFFHTDFPTLLSANCLTPSTAVGRDLTTFVQLSALYSIVRVKVPSTQSTTSGSNSKVARTCSYIFLLIS